MQAYISSPQQSNLASRQSRSTGRMQASPDNCEKFESMRCALLTYMIAQGNVAASTHVAVASSRGSALQYHVKSLQVWSCAQATGLCRLRLLTPNRKRRLETPSAVLPMT